MCEMPELACTSIQARGRADAVEAREMEIETTFKWCSGMAVSLQRPGRPKTTVQDVHLGLIIRLEGVCFCTTCISAHRFAVNRHEPY